MIKHTDEILLPVLDTDASAVPRYNVIGADGQTIYENVALRLANGVAQEGTPVNKPLLDEFLAASGVTAGSATAYTLAQEDFSLFDGAVVRFRLHTASGGNATLDINSTGAKPMRDTLGQVMQGGIPAGTWLTAIYSAPTGAYIFAAGSGGGSNPNLLDNWYFADPVNQRGLTEYTGTGYTIDRWKSSENIVTRIEDDGLLIEFGVTATVWHQLIPRELLNACANRELTVSVLCGDIDGVAYVTDAPGFVETHADIRLTPNGVTTWKITPKSNITGGIGIWGGVVGTTVKLKAIKLELGDEQTLAHQDADGNWILNDPPPDKGMELLKCIQSTADASDTYANKVIATTDYVDSAVAAGGGGSAEILSNTRITADSTSLSISLPTDYTHFRIVMTEVATTDSSNGNVRGSFDVDSANMSNSGMQIAGNSSGTATATAVSMSNAAFLVTLTDADTFGSIVIDIVRYSGITQGTCRWATDGGGNNANVNMGTTNFSAVGTPTSLTVTAMGGFALRSGMAIMVMGVK